MTSKCWSNGLSVSYTNKNTGSCHSYFHTWERYLYNISCSLLSKIQRTRSANVSCMTNTNTVPKPSTQSPLQGVDTPLSYHTFKISKHSTVCFTTQNLSFYLLWLAKISEAIFCHLHNGTFQYKLISFIKWNLPRPYTQHVKVLQRVLKQEPHWHTTFMDPRICCRKHCITKHGNTYKQLSSEQLP
jgi:hypothetical protein